MRLDCPLEDGIEYHVTIPDVWLGSHYLDWLDAMKAAKDARGVLQRFAVCIAICDDYNLPGLTGKPENWDLAKCSLHLMAWVVNEVLANTEYGFESCFVIPKKKPANTGRLFNQMVMAGQSQKPA